MNDSLIPELDGDSLSTKTIRCCYQHLRKCENPEDRKQAAEH